MTEPGALADGTSAGPRDAIRGGDVRLARGIGAAILGLVVLGVVASATAWPNSPVGAMRFVAATTFLLAGVIAHLGHPDDRIGLFMAAVAADLSTPLILTLGLAFPSGTLTPAAGVLVAGEWVLALVEPVVRIVGAPSADTVAMVSDGGEAVICLLVIGLLAHRFRAASTPMRRALLPGYLTGAGALVSGIVVVLTDFAGNQSVHDTGIIALGVLKAALPVSFLIGLLGMRRDRATGALVTQLVAATSGDAIEALVRHALGDDSARLVTGTGASSVGAGRARTPIRFDGLPIGLLDHDPADDPFAVQSVCAAVALVMHNTRLQEEIGRRTAELTAAAGRLVEATDAARRQVERNLHDGAQQRLVAVAVQLRLFQAELQGRGAAGDAGSVGEVADNLEHALSELRTLARGMHPTVLTELGLIGALEALSSTSPLAVDLEAGPEPELSEPARATLYYAAAEALTNAARHSAARKVAIRLAVTQERAVLTISDDGIGGALGEGPGLRSLRDRARALGGDLTVGDAESGGTVLVAEVPR